MRAQAQEVAPNGRQAFLDKLGPVEPGPAGIPRAIEPEDLLADIEELAGELEAPSPKRLSRTTITNGIGIRGQTTRTILMRAS